MSDSDHPSTSSEHVRTITGMRGGLGRTLLSAFLLFTIVPLAIISFLAVNWVQRDMRQEVAARLTAIARLKESKIEAWAMSLNSQLEALSDNPASRRVFLAFLDANPTPVKVGSLPEQILEAAQQAGDLEEIGLFSVDGHLLAATASQLLIHFAPVENSPIPTGMMTDPATGQAVVIVVRAVRDQAGNAQGYLVGLADLNILNPLMTGHTDLGETVEAYLVSPEFVPLTLLRATAVGDLDGEALHTVSIEAALAGQEGVDLYSGYYGEPVIGVYRWLPSLQAALIVEQTQSEAFARADDLVTLLIGAALAVALLTTLLAAVITRQLSRPIVQLTLGAVRIAGGDLEQSVPVERRDEIGILAQAFNIMTAELRTFYRELEHKVAERTRLLREANQRLRYQTMQLAVSAEVGRAITSILELDALLEKVVELIRNSYRLLRVAIYLLDENGHRVVRQARIGWNGNRVTHTGLQTIHRDCLLGRAVADGRPHLDDLQTNIAIPLRAGQRVIGVLKLQAYQGDELAEADVSSFQSLGDQISVAIQNAQTYEVEKGTVERLHRLDQIRAQSLSSMSWELATSLNSIIGFSRLILKGIDGPITDQQRSDVSVINRSGQHLMGLLDDILELIDLESGDHPLEQTSVELNQVVASVIDRVASLAEDKSVTLRSDFSTNLPLLLADGARLQQVLTYLISNSIETATGDAVSVGAWTIGQNGSEVMVCVASGSDAPWPDGCDGVQETLNEPPDGDLVWDGTDAGIKLILSKRIIELHGGRLWINDSQAQPATFVFTLSVAGAGPPAGANGRSKGQVEGIV